MSLSLRWKVLGLILALVTLVIVSMSILILNQQTSALIDNITKNAERETKSIGFLSYRPIVEEDDFAIVDTVSNVKDLEGLEYGAVFGRVVNYTIAEVFPSAKKVEQDKLKPFFAKYLKNAITKLKKKKNFEATLEVKDHPTKNGVKLYIFQRGIFNLLVKKDPPLLGIVQLSFSNEFITQKISSLRSTLILIGAAFWLLGVVGALFMANLIVKPIRKLSEGAKIVGGGDLEYKVPSLGKDEIGALATQFNLMTAGLKVAQEEQKGQAILDDQIKQATEIQEGMNPKRFLNREKYQVKGYTRAAKGVGGDYFDFMLLEDGRLVVLISDVSGKGISASLVMVLIKTVVTTYLHLFGTHLRPDKLLATINDVMCSQAHIDKFATFLFTVLDPETGELDFTNGGHGPVYIYRAKTELCTQQKLEGLPIGIVDGNEYRLAKTNLEKDDILFLFTDGINEAWNDKKEEYGLERLIPKIKEYASLTAKEICDNIIEDLDVFAKDAAEQHDDLTLVVLKKN